LMRSLPAGTVEDPYSAHFHRLSTGRHPGGARPSGGLRMSQNDDPIAAFAHVPVMLAEVVDVFAGVPDGLVVDATIGGAGHAGAILGTHPGVTVLGLDRDPAAVAAAR